VCRERRVEKRTNRVNEGNRMVNCVDTEMKFRKSLRRINCAREKEPAVLLQDAELNAFM
jgi:hypothetical protein